MIEAYPADISDAIHAEDGWTIFDTQGVPVDQMRYQSLTYQLGIRGEWTDSTVEVEVVRVRNDPMTPLPRHNSDDSSESNSDNTEGEDEKEIFGMCYQCNWKVPNQMKENGSCHGRCFHCQRRQGHLVCAAVNPE